MSVLYLCAYIWNLILLRYLFSAAHTDWNLCLEFMKETRSPGYHQKETMKILSLIVEPLSVLLMIFALLCKGGCVKLITFSPFYDILFFAYFYLYLLPSGV